MKPAKLARKPKPLSRSPKRESETPRRTLIAQCCGTLRGLRDEGARMKVATDGIKLRTDKCFTEFRDLLLGAERSEIQRLVQSSIAGYYESEKLGELGYRIEAALTQRECGKK